MLSCRVSFLLRDSKEFTFYIHEQMVNVFLRTYISESIPNMFFSVIQIGQNGRNQAI